MNVFELLFLGLATVALVTLLTIAALAVTGRLARAGRLSLRLAIGVAVYLAVVAVTSALLPRRELHVGDVQRFDDWCLTVEGAQRAGEARDVLEVRLRLENRSRGTPMGEKGTVAYLVDAQEHRYDPLPDPAAVPFDTRLAPGESIQATRRFRVPTDATDLGFVYTHEGGFPIGWWIVGETGWFAKPPLVRLD